jgi:hypothetical protein
MEGSKYVADGKCDGSATKYKSVCGDESQRSLNCLMKNNGDKDACARKHIRADGLKPWLLPTNMLN